MGGGSDQGSDPPSWETGCESVRTDSAANDERPTESAVAASRVVTSGRVGVGKRVGDLTPHQSGSPRFPDHKGRRPTIDPAEDWRLGAVWIEGVAPGPQQQHQAGSHDAVQPLSLRPQECTCRPTRPTYESTRNLDSAGSRRARPGPPHTSRGRRRRRGRRPRRRGRSLLGDSRSRSRWPPWRRARSDSHRCPC